MNATERFLENMSKLDAELGDQPAWLKEQRAQARERFAELGFPTTRHEEWKYTNVAPLTRLAFELPEGNELAQAALDETIERWRLPGSALAVIVDGRWVSERCELAELPEELVVESLRRSVARDPEGLAERLGKRLDSEQQAFTALNAGLWRDGLRLHAPAGLRVERPLQLLCINSGAERPQEIQLRHLLTVERSAEVTLIEHYVGLDGRPTFCNVVSEIELGDNAQLDRYKIELEGERGYHVGRVEAAQGRDARLRSHVFSLSGQLIRDDFGSRLDGVGGDATFNGLFLADGERVVDHHTVVDHAVPNCTSNELYKGILGDKARGVFNGKVFVRQDAQGTAAQQSNKNLLLSRSATINTKPQLEIWADDVKCTHGATVGQLDGDALFYLRARGIGEEQAKSMLIRAFAAELLDGVRHLPLRMQLEEQLEARLSD
jgi:Fe-S cluster assembly protein SufD